MKLTAKSMLSSFVAVMVAFAMILVAGINVDAATAPKKLVISVASTEINVGSTTKVSVKSVSPKKASKAVTYYSSNKSIATVSSKGVVTGKKEGTVTITAKSKLNKKVKSSVKVSVKIASVAKRDVYVTPAWINSVIKGNQPESANYVVLETSTTPDAYDKGHIPGSYFCSVRKFETSTYAAYANNTIDFKNESLGNINSPEVLAGIMKDYGITKDTTVILYGGHPSTERVAFTMLYCGVENVKVLNGNFDDHWAGKYDVETKANTPVAGGADYTFGTTIPAHPEYILDKDEVQSNLEKNKNFKLVSIRSHDEFCGISDGNYPMMQDKGEIAGAVFGKAGSDANLMEEYMTSDNTIIGYDQFKSYMEEANVKSTNEVCFFCGTGWRATMPLLLGYEKGWKVTLYDGGWWAWTRNRNEANIQYLTPAQAKTCSRFNYTVDKITLKVGETKSAAEMAELNPVNIFPASGVLPTVRFKTHKPDVVEVGTDGSLTAKSAGTTTIDMIATDMSGRKTTYTVVVEEAPAEK